MRRENEIVESGEWGGKGRSVLCVPLSLGVKRVSYWGLVSGGGLFRRKAEEDERWRRSE